jgi:hypothetical protein
LHVGNFGEANVAWLRDSFKTSGDVRAVAEDVVPIASSVAHVDADAELDTFLACHRGVALDHPPLDINSGANGVTTPTNSTNMPSPVLLRICPRCSAIFRSINARRRAFSRASVPSSSDPIRRL